MRHMVGIWLMAILACGGVGRAQAIGPTTGPAPISLNDPQALATLMHDLSAEEFKVREAAQAMLNRIPVTQRDALKRLADAAKDAELQARLLGRVEDMDEELALNPPGITLQLKDATLTEVGAALSKETGVSIDDVSHTLR